MAGLIWTKLRAASRSSCAKYIDTREILVELGRRRMVGGQEDMIVDVTLDLVRQRANSEEKENQKILLNGCKLT